MPIQRNKINFSQEMNYPVGALTVMVPTGEATLKGSTLEDNGIQDFPDGTVQIYSGTGLARGEALEFRLTRGSGMDILSPEGDNDLSRGVIIGIGAAGGLLLLTGVWLYIRRNREDLEIDEELSPDDDQAEILDSIIALDDLFQDGEISEEDYSKKRQALKDKLAGID
jgi:hypothetical protein